MILRPVIFHVILRPMRQILTAHDSSMYEDLVPCDEKRRERYITVQSRIQHTHINGCRAKCKSLSVSSTKIQNAHLFIYTQSTCIKSQVSYIRSVCHKRKKYMRKLFQARLPHSFRPQFSKLLLHNLELPISTLVITANF